MSLLGAFGITSPLISKWYTGWENDEAMRMSHDTQDFNATQAQENRNFQERMSNTSWQRGTADMMAAGINPMLAFQHGGASTPAGGQATGAQAHPGAGGVSTGGDWRMFQNAAQIDNLNAQTEKTRAETKEVEQRTPTHQQGIKESESRISEQQQRIRQSIQQIENLKSGERLNDQQIDNLKALIPQIGATIANLKAQTTLHAAQTHQTWTQSGKTAAEDEEIRQRIRANLPDLQRAHQELVNKYKDLERYFHGHNAAANQSFLGALGAVGRALNPFNNLVK